MEVDVLWHLTRAAFDLPEKPVFGEACNRCGLCCLMETCPLGLMFFGNAHGTCPALKLDGSQSHCQLIADPASLLPDLIAGEVQELATVMLVSGGRCDAANTDEDHAVVEARPDLLAGPSQAEGKRAKVLMDTIMDKLRAAAA